MAVLILKCGWRQESSHWFAVLSGISPHNIFMCTINNCSTLFNALRVLFNEPLPVFWGWAMISKDIVGLWISLWAKHAHQAFRGIIGRGAKGLKTDSGVNIITQDSLSGVEWNDTTVFRFFSIWLKKSTREFKGLGAEGFRVQITVEWHPLMKEALDLWHGQIPMSVILILYPPPLTHSFKNHQWILNQNSWSTKAA